MKKTISIVCIAILMLSITCSGWISYAGYEDEYTYEYEYSEAYPLKSPRLTVLLYTDVAKTFTFRENDTEGGDVVGRTKDMFVYYNPFECFLTCDEIDKAIEKCLTGAFGMVEARCALRECVKYFDISKEELEQAFKTMKEDPDAIRPLLSFLTDEEFNSAKNDAGTFAETDWPQEIIDAICMEDEVEAYKILCKPFAIYVPEMERVMIAHELGNSRYWRKVSVDDFATYDLTSDEMGAFLKTAYKYASGEKDVDSRDARTGEEKLAYLEAAREAQLAAKETGDGAVQGITVLALAIPALAATLILRRKKRI